MSGLIPSLDNPNFTRVKVGPAGMYGYPDNAVQQIYGEVPAPTGIIPLVRHVVRSKGDNATFIGAQAGLFEARDHETVTGANKGVLYALSLSVVPRVARNNVPFDDVVGLTISNTTGSIGARATDAIYISNNPYAFGDKSTGTSEWYSLFTADCNADVGIVLAGRLSNYAADFGTANIVSGNAIRIPNNTSIVARDAGGTTNRQLIGIDATDVVNIGGSAARIDLKVQAIAVAGLQVTNFLNVNNGYFATKAPSLITAAAYAVNGSDSHLIANFAGTVALTLPSAGSNNGRHLTIRTVLNQAVVSASANVVPLVGGSAGTAILAATSGKWAKLVSDGAVWQVMEAN